MVESYYLYSDRKAILYKDCYLVYKNLLAKELKELGFNVDIQIFNDNLETNRADLVLIKRVNSPQPPNIALLNQKQVTLNDKQIKNTSNIFHLYFEFTSYGNTFLEAENIGSHVLGILNSVSINELRSLSNNSLLGHEILNWSETQHEQNSPVFFNSVAVRTTFVLSSNIT